MLFSRRAAVYPENEPGGEGNPLASKPLSLARGALDNRDLGHPRFLIRVLFRLKKEKGGKCIPLFLYVALVNRHPGVI